MFLYSFVSRLVEWLRTNIGAVQGVVSQLMGSRGCIAINTRRVGGAVGVRTRTDGVILSWVVLALGVWARCSRVDRSSSETFLCCTDESKARLEAFTSMPVEDAARIIAAVVREIARSRTR